MTPEGNLSKIISGGGQGGGSVIIANGGGDDYTVIINNLINVLVCLANVARIYVIFLTHINIIHVRNL